MTIYLFTKTNDGTLHGDINNKNKGNEKQEGQRAQLESGQLKLPGFVHQGDDAQPVDDRGNVPIEEKDHGVAAFELDVDHTDIIRRVKGGSSDEYLTILRIKGRGNEDIQAKYASQGDQHGTWISREVSLTF